MTNTRKCEHIKHENYDLCHRNEKKCLNVILTEFFLKHIFQALSECGRVVRNINQSDDSDSEGPSDMSLANVNILNMRTMIYVTEMRKNVIKSSFC
jgi:hypothetical protein